ALDRLVVRTPAGSAAHTRIVLCNFHPADDFRSAYWTVSESLWRRRCSLGHSSASLSLIPAAGAGWQGDCRRRNQRSSRCISQFRRNLPLRRALQRAAVAAFCLGVLWRGVERDSSVGTTHSHNRETSTAWRHSAVAISSACCRDLQGISLFDAQRLCRAPLVTSSPSGFRFD